MTVSTRQPVPLIAASMAMLLGLTVLSAAQVAEPVPDIDNADGLVEVSLGDWAVKTTLAQDLGVGIAEIPLTVSVPAEVAADVCPVSSDDLEQQEIISPTRTCAAKRLTEGLRSEVEKQLQPPQQ